MTSAKRAVLVTGASRGIGAAIARRLREDARVTGVRHRSAPPDGVADAWLDEDLAVSGAASRLVSALADGGDGGVRSGGLHGVVLCAGKSVRSEFSALTVDGVDPLSLQIEFDLLAPLVLVRALLHAELLSSDASIVFVGSNLARRGLTHKVAYAAAKAGLEGATRGLAAELGPRGIRVNTVAPGLVRTDMTEELGDTGFEAYAEQVPLRRAGTPEDIADVVGFLMSEAARYVTGQVVDVDGGWSVASR